MTWLLPARPVVVVEDEVFEEPLLLDVDGGDTGFQALIPVFVSFLVKWEVM